MRTVATSYDFEGEVLDEWDEADNARPLTPYLTSDLNGPIVGPNSHQMAGRPRVLEHRQPPARTGGTSSMSVAESTTKRIKVGPNLFQKNGVFYLIAGVQGRQVCEALKATNKTDAKTELAGRLHELRTVGLSGVGDRTVTFDGLTEKFIAHERGPNGRISKRTCDLREGLLRKHVSPVLGKFKAVEITTPHVQALSDSLVKKGLSGSSVKEIITSISCVMGFAVRYGHVQSNPCRDLKLPSPQRQTDPRYLSHEEVTKLLEKLTPEFETMAACCYYAAPCKRGARAPLAGHRPRSRTNPCSRRQDESFGQLGADPASATREAQSPQKSSGGRRAAQDRTERPGLRDLTGRPQSRRNALRAVNVASKHIGLWSEEDGREPVGLHDLRHSAASFYFDPGWKTREVSRLLCHANPTVTLTVYAGLAPAEEEEILENALTAFGGAS